jgi:hypothetical protein
MKTLGRILIILAAFAVVMGITYVVVSGDGSSSTVTALEGGGEGLARPDGVGQPSFPNGERPDFGGEGPGGGWMFGLIKNMGIVAFVVTLIVLPKSLLRWRAVPVRVR